jgi:two-component system cell cycle response regulator
MSQDASAQAAKQRVLIVDDSRIVRTTIARLIRATFDVREEANGEAGWKAISTDPSIVVVFSDIQMPELDGFGLLERIRKSEDSRVKGMPVIVISGDEDDATKKRARAAGANDFITKTTDGTEILSRIDNLLHMVEAKQKLAVSTKTQEQTAKTLEQTAKTLEQTTKTQEQTAIRDPVTGAFTPQFLVIEGNKHFAHARRHGGPLSVFAFRVETYAEIAKKAGKNVADQLLARLAKLVQGTLRTEDSMGRVGEATFAVVFAGSTSQQALAFASRLQEQLAKAQVTVQNEVFKFVTSTGLAALDIDTAKSVEDLMKLALQRLQDPASQKAPPTVPAAGSAPRISLELPAEIDNAVKAIEGTNPERLGEAGNDVLRRLLPFVLAACRRLNVELPVDKIAQALKSRPK